MVVSGTVCKVVDGSEVAVKVVALWVVNVIEVVGVSKIHIRGCGWMEACISICICGCIMGCGCVRGFIRGCVSD